MRKHRWLATATAVMLLAVAGIAAFWPRSSPSSSTADEPYYATTTELEQSAEAIVRGKVERTHKQGDETVATVRVTAVAKGVAGPSIDVIYATAGPEIPEGIRRGGDYVLLLQVRNESAWNLVNTTQGYYPVVDGRITTAPDNAVPLSASVQQSVS
ncbi:hypothetical protein BJ973_002155 [Actinoplanes tereljensis]|uniref:Uncharacterized protein n=1 Tax=Paractinoplanes tereljensis TaxID=571912 RepID=A0A919NX54_9ACTN|nr:hypothetical protein [Actinoplanes tereljensis]GIF26979.1 hypothetical protein Ate02nite_97090 [Actinoplanes tereljensis]